MYKFKNVKKLLIEFSRGEGLSVPTDSIKFVKVDGDELSGATPSGSSDSGFSDGVTVKSLMKMLLDESAPSGASDYNEPDAYYVESDGDLVEIDTVEILVKIIALSQDFFPTGIIPVYHIDTIPGSGYYFSETWDMITAESVDFEQISDEYAIAKEEETTPSSPVVQ